MTNAVLSELDTLPLVAILRGLRPDEAVDVGEAIVAAGFRCLEVPLNSPDPLVSIRKLRDALDGRAVVRAGPVLTRDAVHAVAAAGSQLVISPNTDEDVIRAAKAAGLISMPGFYTPSEAFAALAAGADVLKLFPASMQAWRDAGASGFGIGSSLYKPGHTAPEAEDAARAFVSAWTAISIGEPRS